MHSASCIITGFGPFPGVTNNPSALVIDALTHSGFGAQLALLDTVYAGARERVAALIRHAPAALILTGFSRHAEGFVLETCARAEGYETRMDAAGDLPGQTSAGEDYVNHNVDTAGLVAMLQSAGLPATISHDAGGYVCNHIFWQALDLIAGQDLPTCALFVHLPRIAGMENPPEGEGTMDLRDCVRGISLLAQHLAKRSPAARDPSGSN